MNKKFLMIYFVVVTTLFGSQVVMGNYSPVHVIATEDYTTNDLPHAH